MTESLAGRDQADVRRRGAGNLTRRIVAGLLAGVACGLFFGEDCRPLGHLGDVYVGLLQMTVLPYVVIALISQLGRLNLAEVRRLGWVILVVLLVLCGVGVLLVLLASQILPPSSGGAFLRLAETSTAGHQPSFASIFIPSNIFRSLSDQMVPAVVVFCGFFGIALMRLPGKTALLEFLDVCGAGLVEINAFLIRLAPYGLFVLTAAAAGTLRVEELSRLQAYLAMFVLSSLAAVVFILPLLVSSVTPIGYRALLRAAAEPALTAFATGKLFVVLPQIVDKCDELLRATNDESGSHVALEASVVVPLAYPLPHIGKILSFVFVAFAAWYMGSPLDQAETAGMAATGTVMSFSSPLVSIPFLLDQYKVPQDVMPLFVIPGFLTTRLGDVVGVLHLMALTLITSFALQHRLRIRWRRLGLATAACIPCLLLTIVISRELLESTVTANPLGDRILSLEIPEAHPEVDVVTTPPDDDDRPAAPGATLERINDQRVLRVGYHQDHLPYSYFNQRGHLVGMDVELVHRLAARLQIRLELIPWTYATVLDQLNRGDFDLVVGGLLVTPERLTRIGFSQPYQTATLAIVVPDHRRHAVSQWASVGADIRLTVAGDDLAKVAQRELPDANIRSISSVREFFSESHPDHDGVIMAAEEAAAWTILYPEYTVVIPQPVVRRPVAMAVRLGDEEWARFVDRWLDFERDDGTLERLRAFWVEGGGTQVTQPRWCILRNVLGWGSAATPQETPLPSLSSMRRSHRLGSTEKHLSVLLAPHPSLSPAGRGDKEQMFLGRSLVSHPRSIGTSALPVRARRNGFFGRGSVWIKTPIPRGACPHAAGGWACC